MKTVLAIDLGGTKLATAVIREDGTLLGEEKIPLARRQGPAVGALIAAQVEKFTAKGGEITAIGVSVPGISYPDKGTVWAPNIPGWEEYPLRHEIQNVAGAIPISIDSDRACYITGEVWQGAAQNCTDAIYLAVGTGIGAGIWINGKVLRGAQDIAGAIGWLALERPFDQSFKDCGCFESKASGEGLLKQAKKMLREKTGYQGPLKNIPPEELSAPDVFHAYDTGDVIAREVVKGCVELWGMAVANLVSLFNPQKIILGGGVFGPAVGLIPAIREEAVKWAQPVSMQQVVLQASALGNKAGLFGAGWLALQNRKTVKASL